MVFRTQVFRFTPRIARIDGLRSSRPVNRRNLRLRPPAQPQINEWKKLAKPAFFAFLKGLLTAAAKTLGKYFWQVLVVAVSSLQPSSAPLPQFASPTLHPVHVMPVPKAPEHPAPREENAFLPPAVFGGVERRRRLVKC